MNSWRVLVVSLLLLMASPGCGGGSNHFNFNDVIVSVAPPTATVAAGGQVTLQGSVSGCGGSPCPAPAFTWAIAEIQVNGASGAQCNWQGGAPPPGPCPDGTIEGADTVSGTSVTFHAPNTSGTFHVIVAESSVVNNVPVTKSATAAITVP